ncbi:hypothetical protein BVY03_02325 [bacterium K02(2017)]|nr:hypothetical protein BVY03_02325 [bacterium K02(2017)]
MLGNKRILLISLSVIITLVLVVIMRTVAHNNENPEAPLPIYGDLPTFELVNSKKSEFASKNLDGKVWVANFIFTSCQGVCPILSAKMSKLQNQFKNANINFVSISVDPETDTPEELAKYGKKYGADFNRWHFLTGKKDKIANIMNNYFKLGFNKEPVFHSDRFVLIDHKQRIRGFYSEANKEQFKKLPIDINAVIKSMPN